MDREANADSQGTPDAVSLHFSSRDEAEEFLWDLEQRLRGAPPGERVPAGTYLPAGSHVARALTCFPVDRVSKFSSGDYPKEAAPLAWRERLRILGRACGLRSPQANELLRRARAGDQWFRCRCSAGLLLAKGTLPSKEPSEGEEVGTILHARALPSGGYTLGTNSSSAPHTPDCLLGALKERPLPERGPSEKRRRSPSGDGLKTGHAPRERILVPGLAEMQDRWGSAGRSYAGEPRQEPPREPARAGEAVYQRTFREMLLRLLARSGCDVAPAHRRPLWSQLAALREAARGFALAPGVSLAPHLHFGPAFLKEAALEEAFLKEVARKEAASEEAASEERGSALSVMGTFPLGSVPCQVVLFIASEISDGVSGGSARKNDLSEVIFDQLVPLQEDVERNPERSLEVQQALAFLGGSVRLGSRLRTENYLRAPLSTLDPLFGPLGARWKENEGWDEGKALRHLARRDEAIRSGHVAIVRRALPAPRASLTVVNGPQAGGPFLVGVLFGHFHSPHGAARVPVRIYALPVVSRALLLPVESRAERLVARYLLSALPRMAWRLGIGPGTDYPRLSLRLRAPLHPVDTTDLAGPRSEVDASPYAKPDFFVECVEKGRAGAPPRVRRRAVVEVMGSRDRAYREDKERTHVRMERLGPLATVDLARLRELGAGALRERLEQLEREVERALRTKG